MTQFHERTLILQKFLDFQYHVIVHWPRFYQQTDRNQYLPVSENSEAGPRFRDLTPEHTMSRPSFVSYALAFNIPIIFTE